MGFPNEELPSSPSITFFAGMRIHFVQRNLQWQWNTVWWQDEAIPQLGAVAAGSAQHSARFVSTYREIWELWRLFCWTDALVSGCREKCLFATEAYYLCSFQCATLGAKPAFGITGKKIPNSGLYNSYSFSCFCSLVTYKCPVLFLPFIKVKHWVCCGPKAQQLSLSRYTFVYLVTFRTPPNALVPHKGVRGHFKHRISLGSLAAEREAGNEGGIATTCENYWRSKESPWW